jgi:formate hydrogenlyase subunit 3/multisubunit Na+/H+ antiporter MnhD subunit
VSAPTLWILLPALIGSLVLLLLNERALAITGGVTCLGLAAIAWIVPIDEALRLGPISLKVASTASLLGRSLVLPAAEAPLLVMVFGLCSLWFYGAGAAGVAGRVVPLGLIIVALMVASLAVQPFLYAALLIEVAVLLAVPLLSPAGKRPPRAVIRYLIYQTLGMPFILFAGWLLAGVETSPGDIALTIQSTVVLGLGFAFLLAVFPLNDWMPKLMEECDPYVAGFLLWLFPNIIVIFGMSFLDRYAWLRASPQVVAGLRNIGLLMLLSGGLWSALERNLGRIMAYASITETGFLFLGASLAVSTNADLVYWFLIPRGLCLAVWALALSVLRGRGSPLEIGTVQGSIRAYPWASTALVAAALSAAGLPLLAGFPPRIALWMDLTRDSASSAVWVFVALSGLMVSALRQLAALVAPGPAGGQPARETVLQRLMLGLGVLSLLVLGLYPQLAGVITERIPLLFEHLGR